VIHVGIIHSKEGRRRLTAAGIPVVETWDLTPTPIDMLVGFSHEKAGAAVAEFLYQRGSRRPAIISADDYRAGLRRHGFTEAMARLLGKGAPMPCRLVTAPTSLASGRTGLAPLLDRHPDIDAVFCSSDVIAQGALTEAQARGVNVPSQLKIMGFGDLDFAAHTHPALTTVRVDGTAIGRQAAAFIVGRARGEAIEQRIVDLGFTVVERAST
jgi:LacI family transcriptional regulator, gluconate utilization system Gnt-I transcriptional repressor